MKVCSLMFCSLLATGAMARVCYAGSPHALPGGGWYGDEEYTVNAPAYPFNSLQSSGDTYSNWGNKYGSGYYIGSSRSRPSNSTVTELGISSNEATFRVVWTWEPTGTTPTYSLGVSHYVAATASILSGTSPSGTFVAGATAGLSGKASASATTHGHSGSYDDMDVSDTCFETVSNNGDITCASTGHTVAAVALAGQSFEAFGSLYWWL